MLRSCWVRPKRTCVIVDDMSIWGLPKVSSRRAELTVLAEEADMSDMRTSSTTVNKRSIKIHVIVTWSRCDGGGKC